MIKFTDSNKLEKIINDNVSKFSNSWGFLDYSETAICETNSGLVVSITVMTKSEANDRNICIKSKNKCLKEE